MKKIPVDTIKKILNQGENGATYVLSYPYGDDSIAIEFKTRLSLPEKGAFLERVLSGCFDEEGNYFPEYLDPIFRTTVLQMCSNLPALSIRGSKTADGSPVLDIESMSKLYEMLELDCSDNDAFRSMQRDMMSLCKEAIEWRKRKIVSAVELVKVLVNAMQVAVTSLENLDQDKVTEFANAVADYAKLVSESNGVSDESTEITGASMSE